MAKRKTSLDFTKAIAENSDAEFDRKYGDFIKANLDSSESATKAWASREPNPTKQMSIRLPVKDYDLFRALCKKYRYTNGEMLLALTKEHLAKLGVE